MSTIVEVPLCDYCHKRAYKEFNLGEYALTFCDHHSTKHRQALKIQGWTETFLPALDS